AGGAAAATCFTLAAEAQPLSAGDAGRNLDGQLARLRHASGSSARRARRADDRTGSAALAARPGDGEEALLVSKLAAAVTLRTRRRLGTWGGSCPAAGFARLLSRDLDRGLHSARGLVERDFQVVAQIRSTLRPAAAALPAEHVTDAEDVAKPAE